MHEISLEWVDLIPTYTLVYQLVKVQKTDEKYCKKRAVN